MPHFQLYRQSRASLRPSARLLVAATACLLTAFVAQAQFETASVLGYVRDSAGAAVPNSQVTLVNTKTNQKMTTQTDGQGHYAFPDVKLGQYQVDAMASGFSESVTSPFAVSVSARQRVDVSLKVGSQSESVTVSGAASLLESESSDSGATIGPTAVQNLPLNGRSYADLATLAPGVRRNNLENQSPANNRDASFNVNGQRSEFNNFLLDGLDNNAYGTSNQGFSNQAIPPSPDAINEFRVQTSNYSAEYGRASGAVINVSINSGTNQFHGKIWEYNRNTAFNAIGPFQPPVSALTGRSQKPVLIRNQFGGDLGGPILKNKAFFFIDYEGNRQVQGNYTTATVPTVLQRQGIFTDSTGRPVPVRNPLTGAYYANGIVPTAAWNSLAPLVINALPAPNVPGGAFSNNYASFPNANLVDDKGDGRIDFVLNPRTTGFGRYSQHLGNVVDAASIPGLAGNGGNGTVRVFNRQIAAGITRTVSANSVLDARLGFTWTEGGKTPYLAGQPSLNAAAGIPGLPTDPAIVRSLSSENITTYTSFGAQNSNPQFENPFVVNPKIAYSILKGRHSIKLGYEGLFINTEVDDFNPVYGSETFNGGFSGCIVASGSTTANACAPGTPTNGISPTDIGTRQAAFFTDFLIGARSAYNLNNFRIVNYHQWMNFWYVQDDIKVTPRLTLNAGLRYELVTPQFVTGNTLANFNPVSNTLIQARSGSIDNRALVQTPKLDFAPRLGFAFQLDSKTVIRSAYGISYDQFNREGGENLLAYNGPYVVNSAISQQFAPFNPANNGQQPCVGDAFLGCFRSVQQGYPQNFATSQNFSTALSQTRYIPFNLPTGYVQTWHLDVQRVVAPGTVLTVSYVGSHGVHLQVLADYNQANPNATGGNLSLLARRPVQGFTGIEETLPDGFESYNALQTELEHQFKNGLYFLNSFTWSRALDNASGHLDTPNNDNSRIRLGDPNYNRGQSAYNQPLNETVTVLYDLPYGRGRHFGAHAPLALDYLLGQWQFSAIDTATSGQPVNLIYTAPQAFSVSDLLTYRPNVTGNPVTRQGTRIKTATSVSNYLSNTTVAAPTDASQPFGNAGRNSLRGYPFYQLDIGLHKGFRLWNEASLLDLRGEAFNVLNQVNYGAPDSNISNGSYGTITQAFPPRQLQIALKLIF